MADLYETDKLAALDLAPCYLFSFDHDGLLTAMNKTVLTDLGFEKEELLGRGKFNDVLTVGSKIFFQTHFYPLIRMKGDFNEIFISLKTRSGDEIPVLMNVVMTGDTERHEIHCAGIRISQRNQYEKELVEARKMAENALLENDMLVRLRTELESHQEFMEKKLQRLTQNNKEQKELSTVISHDLQEPLRKILTFLNIIGSSGEMSSSLVIQQRLDKIKIAAERMRYLVLSMQKYVTLNEQHFLPTRVDLNEVFEKVKKEMEPDILRRLVRFEVSDLPEITADAHMVYTLFAELVSNSLKFSDPQKPELHISLHGEVIEQNIFMEIEGRYKYVEHLRLRYSDNGRGFEDHFLGEVFNLFRKADGSTEGLGFGLAYCRKVLALHHGTITVRSNPGVGTEFTILLPKSSDAPSSTEHESE